MMKEDSERRARQYIIALVGSLTCLSVGATVGWSSQISNDLLNGNLGFKITEDQLGWTASLVQLGAALFSLFTGTIADCIGRKLLMLLLVVPATIGWCLLIWPNSVTMLYFGRFITGMVAGAYTVLSAMYSSEIAEKEIRGALGSYTQLMICVGVFYACLLALFLDYKYYTICCAAVPIVFAILFIPMPETPIYLLKKNNIGKAHSSLLKLRGKNYDVDKEIKNVQTSLDEERLKSGYNVVLHTFNKGSTRRACLIGFGLMFLRACCGIDALTAYTAYIFSNAGVGISPNICVIILLSCQLITSVIQSAVVDHFGRRILLCVSGSVMTLCLVVVAVTFLLKDRYIVSEEHHVYINYLPLVAIILFCISFSFGVGPIPWLMMGEVFPQEIKSLASSVGTFITWIIGFVVIKLFIVVDGSWGSDVAFFIFSVFTSLTVVFVIFLVPETKNKSFEEIQRDLQ